MNTSHKARHLLIATTCAALAGCASVQPVAYSGIASSSYMKPNLQDASGRMPYSYATQVDWRKYRRIQIDPVAVYRGADSQFGDMSETDRAALAGYMQAKFAEKLQSRFELANDAGPNTLRLKLTLTGADTTTRCSARCRASISPAASTTVCRLPAAGKAPSPASSCTRSKSMTRPTTGCSTPT